MQIVFTKIRALHKHYIKLGQHSIAEFKWLKTDLQNYHLCQESLKHWRAFSNQGKVRKI